jgi:VCBS repeat-containing protein
MKRICLFTALILTLGILLINVKPALAVPLTPSEFYGTVTINGITSTTATVVGRIAGVQYGGAAIWDCVTLPYCTYVLTVPSDDSDTTGTIEGGVEGNTVDFYVNGTKAAQTGTWHSGGLPVQINLTVTSNVAPVVTEGASTTVTMSEDGSPTAFSLTLHATDANAGDTLTWNISTAALHGTATASGTGASKAIGYTPTANYNGTDSFVVRVSDGSLTDTITVNVSINAVNDAPVITEGTSTSVTMSMNGTPTPFALTLHATDFDTSDTMTWSISTAASHGTATASGTGTSKVISYTPTTDYVGSDSFVVQVSDGTATDTITVNVTINAPNVAPVITEGASTTVTMSEDGSPTAFSLALHATDANTGDTLTWNISTAASHGTATASGTGASKAIGYTPTANYNGTDSFVVQVSDGSLTDTITVNVTITAVISPPGAFSKSLPANTATGVATNPTLSWAASSSAASYEYCYATTSGCTSWISAGMSNSAALSGLSNNQVYYWQVRAVNPDGNTLANAGAYWSFTTAALTPPGIFGKSLPADAATSVATTPVLSWGTSSNATSYEYCYAITFGCNSWISVGASSSASLSGLSNEQTYYWQVRAVNAGGITLANAGTYWSFTTVVTPPGAFSKTSPANGATGVATTPTLSWGTSSGAASYEYCYATTTGCTSWISTGTATSAALSGLSNEQIYYWRVRAVNAGGSTLANAGVYWSFTTVVTPPGAFSKTSPADAATGVETTPTLSWGTSSGAASYEYCYATTTGCTSWISAGMSTSAALSGLLNEQIYYWQVRAINAGGSTFANTGTYWSFTTAVQPPTFTTFLPMVTR